MKQRIFLFFLSLVGILFFTPRSAATDFGNVSVHDPSIIRTPEGMYYIIGSHMGGAKSPDLIRWTQVGSSVQDQPYFRHITEELAEALDWADTETFWAGDYLQLPDGRYLMYYCVCQGSCPQALIGYAVSDSPEGPFTDLGVLRRSNGYGQPYDPGDGSTIYFDIANMPNCIDPHVFYDASGERLWMVYGSYSGGIFILEMNPEDGSILPREKQPASIAENWPYGRRLAGGSCDMEAPYILYSPETEYYYLFLSMGGLGQQDGYNVRVARSTTPYGPYYDERGQNIVNARGNNTVMYRYGLKVMGNHRFLPGEGEAGTAGDYMSPGHNSAYYDPLTKRYFLIFHTRFSATGEYHEVRVHQMQMTASGWPVVAPLRYAGEMPSSCSDAEELAGTYQFIDLGTGESKEIIESQAVTLHADGTVDGAVSGTWALLEGETPNALTMTLGTTTYDGCAFYQYDEYTSSFKWTFALTGGRTNHMLWGVKTEAGYAPADRLLPNDSEAAYVLMNARSGLCLTAGSGLGDTATVEPYCGDGLDAQFFRLAADDAEGTYRLLPCSDETPCALGFRNNAAVAGTPLVNYDAEDYQSGSRKTFFKLTPTDRGTYRLSKDGRTASVVSVAGYSAASGSLVQVANQASGQEGQEWVLFRMRDRSLTDGIESVEGATESADRIDVSRDGASLTVMLPGASGFRLCTVSGCELGRTTGGQGHFLLPGRGFYLVVAELPGSRPVVAKIMW